MQPRSLLWPMIILFSALAAGLVNFLFPNLIGRPIIVMWFLFICPGMMVIRFFQLKEPITEWTLAIALSIAIDGLVAGLQLYSGHWSPFATLGIIMAITSLGAIIQAIWVIIKQV